ncbi:hypothetical protein FNV43_RR20957 [Rhamnella rubrinervis]|uniref:Uncharacterized protein n=1 Tax=Rhamnella rubrinervis TaxID=2594499 RepID=A0A8K0DVC2_9ROSA|nr:hypothetical protein FNV43_RR20957 [Rhamnella rubrinervis]
MAKPSSQPTPIQSRPRSRHCRALEQDIKSRPPEMPQHAIPRLPKRADELQSKAPNQARKHPMSQDPSLARMQIHCRCHVRIRDLIGKHALKAMHVAAQHQRPTMVPPAAPEDNPQHPTSNVAPPPQLASPRYPKHIRDPKDQPTPYIAVASSRYAPPNIANHHRMRIPKPRTLGGSTAAEFLNSDGAATIDGGRDGGRA